MIKTRISIDPESILFFMFTRAPYYSHLSRNSVFAATRNRPPWCCSQLINSILHQFYDMFACFHHLTSQLMSIVHTCTRLFIPIVKLGFRTKSHSTAVMLQPAYKNQTTSILWYVCVFPPSHIAVDVDCSHVHAIIHTYRETRFSHEIALDRGDATASL